MLHLKVNYQESVLNSENVQSLHQSALTILQDYSGEDTSQFSTNLASVYQDNLSMCLVEK